MDEQQSVTDGIREYRERARFNDALFAEIAGFAEKVPLGHYADVNRAIKVFGEGAAEAIADFHVRKARAEGAIR